MNKISLSILLAVAVLLITAGIVTISRSDKEPDVSVKTGPPVNATPLLVESEPVESPPESYPTNLTPLFREDLGFKLDYPDQYGVRDITSCYEGCSPGDSVSAIEFTAGQNLIVLEILPDEPTALKFLRSNANTIIDFFNSSQPKALESAQLNDAKIYRFSIAAPIDELPSIFPDQTERSYILLHHNSGRIHIYSYDTGSSAKTDAGIIADSHNFL